MTSDTQAPALPPVFTKWADKKPDDLCEFQLLRWRTAHIRLGLQMVMTGPVRRMCNGWNDTYHLLPPMTRWDGYKHIIPDDLEWAYGVPKRISEIEHTGRNGFKFEVLLDVEGCEPEPCPFCGEAPTWDSRDGFISAMPHQENQFSLGCCLRTGYFSDPRRCCAAWNTRADMAVKVKPLPWSDYGDGTLHAHIHGYEYEVEHCGENYDWHEHRTGRGSEGFITEEKAKAAAQADYERRYIAGLELAPVTPSATDNSDLEPTDVGDVGNYYGGLWIQQRDGKPEWCIECYDGHRWEPCPEPVFAALRAIAGGDT